jgi:predicted phage tail protein
MTKYDELAKKHMLIEKLAKVKRSSKDRININKEIIDSLKKERDNFRKKLKVKKENNRLDGIDIEEEKRIQSQYITQYEEERSNRKAVESDMKDYQKIPESSKG